MNKSSKLIILGLIVMAAGGMTIVSMYRPESVPAPISENTAITTDAWSSIANTTFRSDSGFAGEGYVFFEDARGYKRAIHQVYGRGVYVVKSDYVGIAVVDENKIQLNDDVYEYKDGKLVSGTTMLTLSERKPTVYSRSGPIDIETVRSETFDINTLSN